MSMISRIGVLTAVLCAGTTLAGTVQFADPSIRIDEGRLPHQVVVVRSGDTIGAATVVVELDWSTGTASGNGADFQAALPATLTFEHGEMVKALVISGVPDDYVEGSEYAVLRITAVTGAALGAASSVRIDIVDLDANNVPRVDFGTKTARVVEGETVTVPVRQSAGTAGAVDIVVRGGSATLGIDYQEPPARIDFPAGAPLALKYLATLDDTSAEGDETIELMLERPTPTGTVVGELVATIVIEDDEPGTGGEFRIEGPTGPNLVSTTEAAGRATLTVRRTRSDGAATIDFVTVPDYDLATGVPDADDYVPATATLAFAPGVSEQRFDVRLLDDSVANLLEAGDFRVVLTNPSVGAAVSPTNYGINIQATDDDTDLFVDGYYGAVPACFVATAAYGSYLDPHVAVLREFRDEQLLTRPAGRVFVAWYYRVSPPLASVIARHGYLRFLTRTTLTPFVYAIAYPWLAAALTVALLAAVAARVARRSRRNR